MKSSCFLICLFVVTCFQSLSAEVREYTNASGKVLRATLVGVGKEEVRLKSEKNGKVYTVQLDQLIPADQDYVDSVRKDFHPHGWQKIKIEFLSKELWFSTSLMAAGSTEYDEVDLQRELYLPVGAFVSFGGGGGLLVEEGDSHYILEKKSDGMYLAKGEGEGEGERFQRISHRGVEAVEDNQLTRDEKAHVKKLAREGFMVRVMKLRIGFDAREYASACMHLEVCQDSKHFPVDPDGLDWTKLGNGIRRLHVSTRGDEVEFIDLKGIGHLSELESLQIYVPQIKNLSELRHLKNLDTLSLLGEISAESLAELGDLHGLRTLSIDNQKEVEAEAYAFLANLKNLQSISIEGKSCPSLHVLESLQDLTYMYIPRLQKRDRAKLMKALPYSYWINQYH